MPFFFVRQELHVFWVCAAEDFLQLGHVGAVELGVVRVRVLKHATARVQAPSSSSSLSSLSSSSSAFSASPSSSSLFTAFIHICFLFDLPPGCLTTNPPCRRQTKRKKSIVFIIIVVIIIITFIINTIIIMVIIFINAGLGLVSAVSLMRNFPGLFRIRHFFGGSQ